MNKEELKSVLSKIGKGALIAATGTAALYILGAIGTINFGSVATPIIAALVPILVNVIREWMKGNQVAGARKLAAQQK
jgi:uncharacterized membrane protein YjjP (DUF1212 family)